jgi:YHS domain-containing protein
MDPRILQFLLFAGLFYLMMRFGCGSHMVHGHHHPEHDGMGSTGPSRDPICGMEVQMGRGYSEIFDGKQYRFCSRRCLDQFDANPQEFVFSKGENS